MNKTPPKRYDRRSDEAGSRGNSDQRTPGQRDRDRILYSSAFRRLGGVTQVASATEAEIFHNRLTHSLKVAQIARRIAEYICLEKQQRNPYLGESEEDNDPSIINPDVVEAAALAHDLGHPPFGHVAEETLRKEIDTDTSRRGGIGDGYEGNAQSFRLVTRLALHREDHQDLGLDLTRATMNAILKYPSFRETEGKKSKKFGAYRKDEAAFYYARGLMPTNTEPCIEAQIMDWADDITYALHDMEDFFHAGLIPLVQLTGENSDERDNFLAETKMRMLADKRIKKNDDFEKYKVAFEGLAQFIPVGRSTLGRTRQHDALKSMTAFLVGQYIRSTDIEYTKGAKRFNLEIPDEKKTEVDILKELTWHYVILSPELATQQHGYRIIIRELYRIYKAAIEKDKREMIPRWFYVDDWKLAGENSERYAADIVSSLTDKQAVMYYGRLMGISPGSMAKWS